MAPSAMYDQYMATSPMPMTPMHLPGSSNEIQLTPRDPNMPPLMSQQGYFDVRPVSQVYQQPPLGGSLPASPPPGAMQLHPLMQGQQSPTPSGYQNAPAHLPYPFPHHRQSSNLSQQGQQVSSSSRPGSTYFLPPQGGEAVE
jgi:hypothetical protein